jgi:hypothetical protein
VSRSAAVNPPIERSCTRPTTGETFSSMARPGWLSATPAGCADRPGRVAAGPARAIRGHRRAPRRRWGPGRAGHRSAAAGMPPPSSGELHRRVVPGPQPDRAPARRWRCATPIRTARTSRTTTSSTAARALSRLVTPPLMARSGHKLQSLTCHIIVDHLYDGATRASTRAPPRPCSPCPPRRCPRHEGAAMDLSPARSRSSREAVRGLGPRLRQGLGRRRRRGRRQRRRRGGRPSRGRRRSPHAGGKAVAVAAAVGSSESAQQLVDAAVDEPSAAWTSWSPTPACCATRSCGR